MKNWNDIYELPLEDSYIDDGFRSKRITDKKGSFVFEFLKVGNNTQEEILNVINKDVKLINRELTFTHADGYISVNEMQVIMIRGWGNLTGTGGFNLSNEDAANVQDTLAEYIVSKLNER